MRLRVHEPGKAGNYEGLGMCEIRMAVDCFQGVGICGNRRGEREGKNRAKSKKARVPG